jgi:hypothetical protein
MTMTDLCTDRTEPTDPIKIIVESENFARVVAMIHGWGCEALAKERDPAAALNGSDLTATPGGDRGVLDWTPVHGLNTKPMSRSNPSS